MKSTPPVAVRMACIIAISPALSRLQQLRHRLPAPVFLGIDRLDTLNGVRAYLNGRKRLLAALASELEMTKPDAILTFGPDGEYGHPEHIVIGAAITEVLLRDGLTDTYPLYYFLWKKEQVADDDELSYVDARYITHQLAHTDEDEQWSFAASRCYTSQMTTEEIDALVRDVTADTTNTYFFRRERPMNVELPGDARVLTIRPATAADAAGIWSVIEPTIRAGETYTLDPQMSEADALAYWLASEKETFVAEEDGAIVGTYFMRPNQAAGGAHVCNCGYMTSPHAMGRGIARAMCEHSLAHARARGYRAMQFNFVVSTNERAVRLWQSLGFTIVGRLPGAFRHPAQGYVDALVMFQQL